MIECPCCSNICDYFINTWRPKKIVGNMPHIQVSFSLFERMIDLKIISKYMVL